MDIVVNKVVKKGEERGRWVDSSVCFETKTQTGLIVWCMYERAGNFLLTVNRDVWRRGANQDKYNSEIAPRSPEWSEATSFYFRIDRLVVGTLVENEQNLYKGKKRISREEFSRHYNYVRMQIVNETVYLEP